MFDYNSKVWMTLCLNLVSSAAAYLFNPLPHKKNLDWSKLKAFADDKIKLTENLKSVLWKIENIVGKGENAGYQFSTLHEPNFKFSVTFILSFANAINLEKPKILVRSLRWNEGIDNQLLS